MQEKKNDWVHLNLSLPHDLLARVDKVVAQQRRKNPDMVVTRLDVIREYIREGLPS